MLLLLLLGEKDGKKERVDAVKRRHCWLAGSLVCWSATPPCFPGRRLSDWVRILGSSRAYCSSKFVAIKESPIDRFYSRIDLASGYDVIDLKGLSALIISIEI